MKEEDLLKTLGDVDEKFIDEAAPTDYPESAEQPDYTEIITRKEPFYMKILPIAACLAFVGVGITAGVLIKNNALNPAAQTTPSSYPTCEWSSSVTEVSEAYRIPHWDELDINGQYTSFKWQGCAYDTAGAEISAEKLGEFLGETTASGVDEYTDEKHEITVSVYPIAKINEKTALAVQFPENEKFYVYYNQTYKPQTLGDFIDDLNLAENLKISDTATATSIENLYLTNRKYSDIDTSKLMEILLSGRNVPTESMFDYNTFVECDRFEAALDFAVDIPILGIENLSLEITKGGFVHTNAFFHTSTLFYLGKDKTDPFVQYVKENCPSKITWQSDEPLKMRDEIRQQVVPAFRELGYINVGIRPDMTLGVRPETIRYVPDCVDMSVYIIDEVIEQRGVSGVTPDKVSEQKFYLIKSGDYATEESFKNKLGEFLTEGCRENFIEFLLCRNIIRFKDGNTFVSAIHYDSSGYLNPEFSKHVTITAKFDEKRSNLLNVTVKDFIRESDYTAIFEKGSDGKYRICTADFSNLMETFSTSKVAYTFLFGEETTGYNSSYTGYR